MPLPERTQENPFREFSEGVVNTLSGERDAPTGNICTGQVRALIETCQIDLALNESNFSLLAIAICKKFSELTPERQEILAQNLSILFEAIGSDIGKLTRHMGADIQVKIAVLNAVSGQIGRFSISPDQPTSTVVTAAQADLQHRIGETIKRAESCANSQPSN